MTRNPQDLWSIILAGGNGERLKPMVQRWLGRHKPKQYCNFVGTRSMFEHTLDRTHGPFGSEPSPDGFVESSGLIEIKCPMTKNHLETLSLGEVPPQYELQIQSQLACTNREWVDFVSYDPRLPERLKLFVKRIFRSEPMIEEIEKQVKHF